MRRIPPGLAAAGLAALGEQGNAAGGGGSCTDPTISSTLGNVADQSGAYEPTLTHDGASVLTTATNTTSGSVTVTDPATTTPSVPEPAAGTTTLVTHTTTAASGLTASISFAVSKAAAASGGPSDVVKFADIGGYDFTTTGGTGGSGGAGPHTLPDGTTCTVYEVGTFTGSAAFSGGKLTGSGGDSSNHYIIEFDLGSDTEWVPLWIMGQFTVNAASVATGDLRVWMGEATYTANNVADDLQLISVGTDTMRFRFANSASTFNTVLEMTGLSLGSTDQFEFMFRGHTNAWSTVEGRQGTGSLPAWNDAVMANVNGDVRNAVPSWRRYLRVKVGQNDLDLDLHVQKGL